MLFNSTEFLVFYAVVLAVYYAVGLTGAWWFQKLVLLVASYAFYISWNPPFVVLLFISTAIDFIAAARIHEAETPGLRRFWLVMSLVTNLGILGYFKYGAFAFESLAWLGGGTSQVPAFLRVTLPLGISFYTFQSISYTIDVYRGLRPPCPRLLDFALYVAFFPQLVAGPIVRATHFLPQLRARPAAGSTDRERALMLITFGLFKKVVCADVLGEYVDLVFGNVQAYHGVNLLVAAYAYAFQIYFDFSGYSDMAIGLAGLLGFNLPVNFRLPYVAQNPREFWQRWHISLSTWLRDYLYIPLGGNRRGRVRTYCNLAATMLLGGLWHGAAWNFVGWGGYHGALLALHRLFRRGAAKPVSALAVLARRVAMFHLVCIGWVLFRAESARDIFTFFHNLMEPGLSVAPAFIRAACWTGFAFIAHQVVAELKPARRFLGMSPVIQGATYAAVVILVFLFSPATQRFIYFEF